MIKQRFADTVKPTTYENVLGADEIIVSKTDLKGHITYANDVFLRIAQLSEKEAIGSPHCLVRHPDMPRGIFKLLWDTLTDKREIFAYVKNMAKNGNYYWVFAHVTPSMDSSGTVISYHSSRRKPTTKQIEKISPLYATLLDIERKCSNPKEAANASLAALRNKLKQEGCSYDEYVFTI
ncbi:MAG: PAS domain-containing protein [Bdellovibrionales bacterium]